MAAVEKRAFEHKRTRDDGPQPRHPRRAHHLRAQAGHLVRRAAPRPRARLRARARRHRGGEDLRRGGHLRAPASAGGGARLPASWGCARRRPRARSSSATGTRSTSRRWRCWARRIEKFAVEIRHLQRTEVREAEEPFTAGQKGSSAPCRTSATPSSPRTSRGLARLLRGYAVSALEDVALWHERDISHSSVERVIGPDATIVAATSCCTASPG